MTYLTDDDRTRMAKLLQEVEQEQAAKTVAIHEASHAVAYWHLADDTEYIKDDVVLTLIWDAGICKGCCVSPALPGRQNAVKSIAGVVGESVIPWDAPPTAEQFREFCESDFEIPPTDGVALEWAAQKRELATEAAEILLANYKRVQSVADVLRREAALGRWMFRWAVNQQA